MSQPRGWTGSGRHLAALHLEVDSWADVAVLEAAAGAADLPLVGSGGSSTVTTSRSLSSPSAPRLPRSAACCE
ncbi:hypothetical protein GCM10010304_74800 [Streptomyces roseoviolaceus]